MIVEYIRYTVSDEARQSALVNAYHEASKTLMLLLSVWPMNSPFVKKMLSR